MAECLDNAIERLLKSGKSPKRKVGELDNRGSHYYLAMYWADELSQRKENPKLSSTFSSIAKDLTENEDQIVLELNNCQGISQEISGYYMPKESDLYNAMRPSLTLNTIIDNF